jgi:hypothetical protein
VKEARREIFSAIKNGDLNAIAPYADDDTSPRTQSPQPSPPPPPPPPTSPPARPLRLVTAPRTTQSPAWGGVYTSPRSVCPVSPRSPTKAVDQLILFTERNLPPTCRHCNVFFVTFASVDCRHADACFACASRVFDLH